MGHEFAQGQLFDSFASLEFGLSDIFRSTIARCDLIVAEWALPTILRKLARKSTSVMSLEMRPRQ